MDANQGGIVAEGDTDIPIVPQESRKKRRFPPLGVAVVALFMFGCILSGILGTVLVRTFIGQFQEQHEPEKISVAYFEALRQHNWTAAHGYLTTSLQASNSPAQLGAKWVQREAKNGTITGFTATSTGMSTSNVETAAVVRGTVGYSSTPPEASVISL